MEAGSIIITDGDTIRLGAERIRVVNIDAPELTGRCDSERLLALAAKDRLALILDARQPEIARTGKDRFGRTLAYVRVSGADVGEMLIFAHLAVPWGGRQHDWCADNRPKTK